MAKGFIRVLRGYEFVDKNPVIDRVRTLAQDRGLYTKLGIIEELSSVKRGTLHGWWHGDTKRPQHHTLMAVVHALGYREEFVPVNDAFDVDTERKRATAWRAKQPEPPKKKTPTKRKTRKKK